MAGETFGGLFGETDHQEEQLKICDKQLWECQKQLNRLGGVDTPEAAAERQKLGISIYELQTKKQDIQLSQQKAPIKYRLMNRAGLTS